MIAPPFKVAKARAASPTGAAKASDTAQHKSARYVHDPAQSGSGGQVSSNRATLRYLAEASGEQAAGPGPSINQMKSSGWSPLARQPHPSEAIADPCEREAERAGAAVATGQPAVVGGPLTGTRGAEIGLSKPVATALSNPGAPLPSNLRTYFELRFGQDFSQVRVHADTAAGNAARSINARAFTFGHRIAFAAGAYAPGTSDGRRLLAHELAHIVQQSAGETRIQRAPDSDRLADLIDRHPAWGTWIGGSGSVEGYQELEQNVSGGEAGFYQSAEFRAWYMSGWRGLQRFEDPTKALQFVASVLITDAAARNKFFADIKIGPPGGQAGKVASDLDQARKTGNVDKTVAAIEQVSVARKSENMAQFGLSDFDSMAKDREVWSGPGVNSFERWTLAGAEVSPEEISRVVNREIEQKRQIPQIDKDWKWFAVDKAAGEKKVHSTQMAKEGKIPSRALGGVSVRYYKLSDGRIITREFWHRAKPDEEDRGSRMLIMIWSAHMGPDRLSHFEASSMYQSMQGFGTWTAGRMAPGGGFGGGSKPSGSPAKAPKPGKVDKPATAPPSGPAKIPVTEFNPRIAVFDKNGNLIVQRNAVSMSHQGMLDQNKALGGKLPEGGRAVTVIKENGALHAIDSKGIHGSAVPSPRWVQDAVKKHFE